MVANNLPVVLDAAGFVAVVVGVFLLFGYWGWIAAGGLLMLSGLRAGD